MSQREFTDSKGTHWLVWSTTPTPGAVLASDMQKGWLTFESDTERRRLVPVPRTTPIRGVTQQSDDSR